MAIKKKFWHEFKRQIRLAITAAIGFIIAFAWKDYIIQFIGSIFNSLKVAFPITSTLLTALLLTILGIALIFLSARLLE